MYGKDEQEALGQDGHVDGDAFVGIVQKGNGGKRKPKSREKLLRRWAKFKRLGAKRPALRLVASRIAQQWAAAGYQPSSIAQAARQAGLTVSGTDPMSLSGAEQILVGPRVQASSTLGHSAYRRGLSVSGQDDGARPATMPRAFVARCVKIAQEAMSQDPAVAGKARKTIEELGVRARGGDDAAGNALKTIDKAGKGLSVLRQRQIDTEAKQALGVSGDAFVGGRSGQGFLTASPRGFSSAQSPEWFQSHGESYLSESGGRGGRGFLTASPRGFMSAQSPDWFQSHPEEYLSESGGDAFVGKVGDVVGAICGTDAYKRGM